MSNMLDYLLWRGDLSLKKAAFNDIDALILSRMIYTKFDGIVPNGYLSGTITIWEAIKQVLAKTPASDHEDHKLLQLLLPFAVGNRSHAAFVVLLIHPLL